MEWPGRGATVELSHGVGVIITLTPGPEGPVAVTLPREDVDATVFVCSGGLN